MQGFELAMTPEVIALCKAALLVILILGIVWSSTK